MVYEIHHVFASKSFNYRLKAEAKVFKNIFNLHLIELNKISNLFFESNDLIAIEFRMRLFKSIRETSFAYFTRLCEAVAIRHVLFQAKLNQFRIAV